MFNEDLSLDTWYLYTKISPLIKNEKHKEIKSILLNFYSRFFTKPELHLLHCSIHSACISLTQYLLKIGYNVNAKDSTGRTALMLAIQMKLSMYYIRLLIEAGADVEMLNNDGQNALDIANQDRSAYICPRQEDTLHALFRAFRQKCSSSEETAEKLIAAGYHLYHATYTADAEVIEHMLKRGSSIDCMQWETKQTALHVAATYNDPECMRVLLKNGADTNVFDVNGRTPLLHLLNWHPRNLHKNVDVLKVLLDRFSCGNQIDADVLHGPLARGNIDVVRLVLRSKLITILKDTYFGTTTLHYLAKNFNAGVIEELEQHVGKYDVNAHNKFGESPLYWAVEAQNASMVDFLLEQRADPNTDSSHHAIIRAHFNYPEKRLDHGKIIQSLLQHGADPQVTFTSITGKTLTIFDDAVKSNDCERMTSAIAHLAVLERLGTDITQIIRSKIDSHLSFSQYFNECRRILTKSVWGPITVFKLLTQDVRKLAAYLNNEELVIKLIRIRYKLNVRSKYAYYYNTIEKRLIKARQYKHSKDRAAQVIQDISKKRFNADDLVVLKIIDFLSDQDLKQLGKLSDSDDENNCES